TRQETELRSPRFGIVAGWGRYPAVVAQSLRRRGYSVFCLGIKGHAQAESLRPVVQDYHEVGLARLGAAIRYFCRNDVHLATMAGKIHKVRLFQRFAWLNHFPDWRGL